MGNFNKFEDIQAWQKARELNKYLFSITNSGKFKNDFSLKDQILRAANSIMLNIAEGFARRSNKEFIQYLVFAHGSASEIQSAIYIAIDREYIQNDIFTDIYNRCEEISKMIMGLIKYLKNN